MSSYAERARAHYLETGTTFPRRVIQAVALVKAAVARANASLGLLKSDMAKAIEEAAMQVAEGKHDNKITVDVFQTGSGTGLNMNVNEVIAGIATELLGRPVHPNDHVNMGQSSNDVIPTAIRLAACAAVRDDVVPALRSLASALRSRAAEYADAVKPGRTHLRDAVPVTFGQELEAYAYMVERDADALEQALQLASEVPLGGTAVGTGLNAHPELAELAIGELARLSGCPLRPAGSRMARMRSVTDLVLLSAALRSAALDLMRISQDLRILSSGPYTGIAEVEISEEIAGSSIMPGKVNPVTLEAVNQAAAQVVGLDGAVAWASSLGELELNMGLPLTGYDIQLEAQLVSEAARKLEGVIRRMRANVERMMRLAGLSQALITVASPLVGYDLASRAAELARSEGLDLLEALRRVGAPEEAIAKVKLTLGNLLSLTRPRGQ